MRTECLVIGGGPAGLTAAIYLARFHLPTIVLDSGSSRAALISLTRNHAGFPDGISGPELLARMRAQSIRYGAHLQSGQVDALETTDDGFVARVDGGSIRARAVLLATGVVNRRPPMIDVEAHDHALARGLLRYCPICDGYEVTDKRVALLGTGEHAVAEAIFLRSYSANMTLVAPPEGHLLTAEQRGLLDDAGVALAGNCRAIRFSADKVIIEAGDRTMRFDTLYPALGSDIRSELAGQVGACRSGDGCLTVDTHQRTNISGLYAAGDVVLGLDQISHAMGEGGVAATTIRNDLAQRTPLRR